MLGPAYQAGCRTRSALCRHMRLKERARRQARKTSGPDDPLTVLVYSMGKVGYSRVYNCIQTTELRCAVESRLGTMENFEYVLSWFDREIKEFFSIDLFSSEFYRENGVSQ